MICSLANTLGEMGAGLLTYWFHAVSMVFLSSLLARWILPFPVHVGACKTMAALI